MQQLVRAHNMDARDFVRALYKETPPVPFTQVIMNLPASAESFLGPCTLASLASFGRH